MEKLTDFHEAAQQVAEAVSDHLAANPTETVTTRVIDSEGRVHAEREDSGPSVLLQPKDALLGPDGLPLTTKGRAAGRMSVGFSIWNSPWKPGAE